MRQSFVISGFIGSAIIFAGLACSGGQHQHAANKPAATPTIAKPTAAATQPANYPGLHNVVSYADKIISGSVPEGAEGFETIHEMGITTVISVDGAAPDVELARKYGLKYIHLPIGYNGLSSQRTLEIAKAVKDANGPVYLHCHHGKHRSAGAAGAAAVALGLMTNDEATAKLKVSGTAPAYKGLYNSVAVATPAGEKIDAITMVFPEVCKPSGITDAMVEIDEINDLLKAVEKAGWKPPTDHPDLVPAAEAGRLVDAFRHAHADPHTKDKPKEYADWLEASTTQAKSLEDGLVAGNVAADELSKRFKLLNQSCKDCHVKYRDPVLPQ